MMREVCNPKLRSDAVLTPQENFRLEKTKIANGSGFGAIHARMWSFRRK